MGTRRASFRSIHSGARFRNWWPIALMILGAYLVVGGVGWTGTLVDGVGKYNTDTVIDIVIGSIALVGLVIAWFCVPKRRP